MLTKTLLRLYKTPNLVISSTISSSFRRYSKMTKVSLNGQVLAESNETVVVENNHYFPPSSVEKSVLSPSNTSSVCPWKGTASYYNATVGDKTVQDIAWYYPSTITDRAKPIEGYVAFYKNKVTIE